VRVVSENDNWVAFVPFAARWPFEVHIYPREQVSRIQDVSLESRDSLARIYEQILFCFETLFEGNAAYVSSWLQAPKSNDAIRFHIEVTSPQRSRDKYKYLAGSETGVQAFINDVLPEAAAEKLREALLRWK